MGDFTRETRKKLTDQWIAEFRKRGEHLDGNQRRLLPEREDYYIPQASCQWIAEAVEEPGRSLSWFYRTRLQGLVDLCVGKEYEEEFYYALDQLNQFQMTAGWYRRSLRGKSYAPFARASVALLWAYARLQFYGCRLDELLTGQTKPEIYDHARTSFWSYDKMLAARIDRGNRETIQAVKDILLGEGNVAMAGYELIRGIVMSKNQELHELLGKFLLAARLQEGVRQAVCETMDAGRPEAFLCLFRVIEENNLVRYSSVKRAVSTWIGIFNEKSVDRITDKLVRLMGRCLREPDFCREQLKTNDSVAISCALWAMGFYDAEKAVEAELELIRNGTKNQKMTASYFNMSLQDTRLRMQAAREVLLRYPEDSELAACFMPGLFPDLYQVVRTCLWRDEKNRNHGFYSDAPVQEPEPIPLSRYFENTGEAEVLYGVLKALYARLPQKGLILNPCIFPWHQVQLSRSQVAGRLCFLAFMLGKEEVLEEAAQWVPVVGQGDFGGMTRGMAARLLLWRPQSPAQRRALFALLHNPDTDAVRTAVKLVEDMGLQDGDFRELEGNLRYKTGRRETLALLERQDTDRLCTCVGRLLAEKSQESHMGALELAMRVKERDPEGFERLLPVLETLKNPAGKEQVLLEELTGANRQAGDILQKPGYGLYDPEVSWKIPEITTDPRAAARLFTWGDARCIKALKALDQLIEKNRDREYKPSWGDETTLGARLVRTRYISADSGEDELDAYPFKELWLRFYEEEIGDPEHLIELYLYQQCRQKWDLYQRFEPLYRKVLGSGLLKKLPFKERLVGLTYGEQVRTVIDTLFWHGRLVPKERLCAWAMAGMSGLFNFLQQAPDSSLVYTVKEKRWNGETEVTARMPELPIFQSLYTWLWRDEEQWQESFAIRFRLDQLYRERVKMAGKSVGSAAGSAVGKTAMAAAGSYVSVGDFVRCVARGIWNRDMFLKAMFAYGSAGTVLGASSSVVQKGNLSSRQVDLRALRAFFGGAVKPVDGKYRFDQEERRTPEMELAHELYHLLVPVFLKVELRRGEAATPFSEAVRQLRVVYGIDTLIQVLTAMGDDVLKREHYYWAGRSQDKGTALSHILKVCYPAPGETAQDLKRALRGTDIARKRLVELAMYAPQWIPLLEEYLEMPGLKSGCYYFMAHTSERMDEFTTSMVAKYTPLSPEELQGGAFDVNWFFEAYGALGEKNFKLLYDAAKYSSSGTAHARARKYADAALGKTDAGKLKTEIGEKRNKDLLMSFSLLPLPEEREARERELLDRYQFIEKFRKESRRFGAQRRSSEGKAADLALRNLSVKAGLDDPSRLTLRMETRLSRDTEDYFNWLSLDGETRIRVEVDEAGAARLVCEKAGKPLKSLPTRFKKEERVLEYQAAAKRLKEQYSRTRQMMEQAMEDRTVFYFWELSELLESPVVRPILEPLVFGLVQPPVKGAAAGTGKAAGSEAAAREGVSEAAQPPITAMGFLAEGGLRDASGELQKIPEDAALVLVHPYDLYAADCWQDYQKYLFEHRIAQPFKQVFRELYVKLTEEKEKRESRMFAGNQIQPRKTVGALRSRRWVADYEDGLQKIYYKENIVARIYAMADWFSPSDIEAPTLEYVVFEDRKTLMPLKLEEVPDIIYSEVMRDVDLAVSVAHAGGVDPETSHSTVEMRRAIVACSLELFGIKNVRLEKNHAYIEGRLGSYTIHLGSGVIHQPGNAMLYVVPVHSQQRGRIFLPFMDDDPKTAEILSKVLLFAEDWKIRDPKILEQIR